MQEFKLSVLIILLAFFIYAPKLYTQKLVTDRPDQTESAVTVPYKSLQVETGLLYENTKLGIFQSKQYSIAGTLFRYGLEENFELRFGSGYFIHKTDITTHDFDDLLAGFKVNFLREDYSFMDLGLMAHVIVPFSPEFSFSDAEPEIILSAFRSLSDKFSLAVNSGVKWLGKNSERNYFYTSAVGYSITERAGIFLECFGNLSPFVSPEHFYDGGLTFFLSEYVQLDLSAGRQYSGDLSYWFAGSGVSFRLNNL